MPDTFLVKRMMCVLLPRSLYSQCKAPNIRWGRSSAGTPSVGRRSSIQLTSVDRRVLTCSRNSKARRYELKSVRTYVKMLVRPQ